MFGPAQFEEIAHDIKKVDAQVARLTVTEFPKRSPAARMNPWVVVAPRSGTHVHLPVEVVRRRRIGWKISGSAIVTVDVNRGHLAELKENVIGTSTKTVAASREVTILADRTVPFAVVEKIMSTCTAEGYENVSLAVIQKNANAQVAAL